jgi:hypothetical protein
MDCRFIINPIAVIFLYNEAEHQVKNKNKTYTLVRYFIIPLPLWEGLGEGEKLS